MAEAGTAAGGAGQAGNGAVSGAGQAGAAGGVTATVTTTGVQSDWTSGFADDLKGYVTTKGFQNAGAVADAYRNLEKLHGAGPDKLLRMPDNLSAPEARAFWERIGAPKEAKEYNIEIPKEHGDQALADWFKDTAFKNNMTKTQAESFVKTWNERAASSIAAAKKAAADAQTAAEANLKTEWGAAFEKNKNMVEQTAAAIGITADQAQALGRVLGPEGAPKLMLKLASAVKESDFVGGAKGGGDVNTPDGAMSKIKQLSQDPAFMSRYLSGDKNALEEMTRAQSQAYIGEQFLG